MTIQTPHTVEPFPIREGRDKAAVLAVARLIEVAPGRDMRITLTRTYAADPDAHTTTILAAVADRALAAEMAAVLGLTGVLFDLGVAWVGHVCGAPTSIVGRIAQDDGVLLQCLGERDEVVPQ